MRLPWKKKSREENEKEDNVFVLDHFPSNFWQILLNSISTVILLSVPFIIIHLIMIYTNITLTNVIVDETKILTWSIGNIIVPTIFMYIVGMLAAIYILPLQGTKYAWWLIKNSVYPHIIMMSVSIVIMMIILFLTTTFNVDLSDYQQINASSVSMVAYLSMIIPVWIGYRTGYKSYRLNGAQTMQDRWEKYNRELEVKHQGQAFEKLATGTKKITGKGRDVPRGSLIFCVFLQPMSLALGYSIGASMMSPWMASIWFVGVTSIVISIVAAITKYRDYKKMNKGKEGLLDTRRYPDTIDEWDASDSGIPVYH